MLGKAIMTNSVPSPGYAVGDRELNIASVAARQHFPCWLYTAILNCVTVVKL